MISSELRLDYVHAYRVLLPLLRGRVFHVTCGANLPAILTDGQIKANVDGKLKTAFGSSENSFFRLRGRVSVFDYRTSTDEEIDKSLTKCSPYQAGHMCGFELAFFFLNDVACSRLEPWVLWKTAKPREDMGIPGVVPYVEAGHPGGIPMADIDEILKVVMRYEPSPLELAVQAACAKQVPR